MKNEDKILKLLENLTTDVSGIKSDVSNLKIGQSALEEHMDMLDSHIDKLELRMENEVFNPIHILSENVLELIKQQAATDENIKFMVNTVDHIANKIDDHGRYLERIEEKLESHDIQIHVLDKTKSNKRKVK